MREQNALTLRPCFISLCLLLSLAVCFPPARPFSMKAGAIVQSAPLVINEYLADPPDGPSGDANGDGARDAAQDEFIELVNSSAAPLDVSGFTVADAAQIRFTLPPGRVIPPGEAAVIFGGGNPSGPFGNASANDLVFAVAASAGLSLNNGGDSIIVRDASGREVARRDYPASDGSANQSITRSPDVNGAFVTHLSATGSSGRLFSPGTLANGFAFTSTDPAIDMIAPDSVVVGSGAALILITGANFQTGSQARIDGAPVDTIFASPQKLTVIAGPTITSVAGTHALVIENSGGIISNSATFTVLGAVGINEYLADPPDGPDGDANGDGTRSTSQDEFIEIINRTGTPLDIGGFTVSDAESVRFAFPAQTILPAGESAVIFGGGSPRGEFGNAAINNLVFTANLSLNNGGDSITLRDNSGASLESITFGAGEGNANQSINRNPDSTGSRLIPHSMINGSDGRLFSPGARASGEEFTAGPRISRITPEQVGLNAPAFDLFIHGTGFELGMTVDIGGSELRADFLSENELAARVPESVTATAGSRVVRARSPGGNLSNALALAVIAPPPLISLLVPRFVQAGTGQFTLIISGASFNPSSRALVDGSTVATSFLNAREIRAVVPSSFSASTGTRSVQVRNGDGQLSGEAAFEVIAPGPRIDSISPGQVIAGGPGVRLTIRGASFQSKASVFMDQARLVTLFVSATQLAVEVPEALVSSPGLRAIAVHNEDGSVSNESVFRVVATAPFIHSIDPRAAVKGGPGVAITITGENFKPGARARILDGSGLIEPLATIFFDEARLQAALPSPLLEKTGRLLIEIENADFGVSNAIPFEVLIDDPLVVNEFLADPPEGLAGDANGDGSRSISQDEFIELVNRTTQPLDISGYRLSDAEAVRHVFAEGAVLPPFEASVVFGGGAPSGRFGNAGINRLVFKASSGGLSLNNGGDTIKLEDRAGRVVQVIDFGTREGNANQSVNRDPDAGGSTFVAHSTLAESRLFSPGARVTGEAFTTLPIIRSLAPASTRVNSEQFELVISGEDFLPGAIVLFGQAALETRFLSNVELRANVGGELLVEPGAREVRVRNAKGELSPPAKFLIVTDPPRISSISPQAVGSGAEALEVTLAGERFEAGAKVRVEVRGRGGAAEMEARFIEPSSISVVLDERFFERAAELVLRVLNADGNQSNDAILIVENGPLITRLNRSRIRAGRGDVDLMMGGLAFKPGISLFVNESEVPTTFLNEESLTARIPEELTRRPGLLVLQARNRDGGRSNRVMLRVVE